MAQQDHLTDSSPREQAFSGVIDDHDDTESYDEEMAKLAEQYGDPNEPEADESEEEHWERLAEQYGLTGEDAPLRRGPEAAATLREATNKAGPTAGKDTSEEGESTPFELLLGLLRERGGSWGWGDTRGRVCNALGGMPAAKEMLIAARKAGLVDFPDRRDCTSRIVLVGFEPMAPTRTTHLGSDGPASTP